MLRRLIVSLVAKLSLFPEGVLDMGKPKKRTSHRATGARRSHLVVKLARAVNAKSPVKARTTVRENPKAVKVAN